jgi:dephospho-CoA kinase
MYEIVKQMLWYRLVAQEERVVLDAPLLFETHLDLICAQTIVVACDEDTEIKRLMGRDGVSEEEAKQALQSQMPLQKKIAKATHVVYNNGTMQDLEMAVDGVAAQVWTYW